MIAGCDICGISFDAYHPDCPNPHHRIWAQLGISLRDVVRQGLGLPSGVEGMVNLLAGVRQYGFENHHFIAACHDVLSDIVAQQTKLEEHNDRLTDLLDRLVGWCSPHISLTDAIEK